MLRKMKESDLSTIEELELDLFSCPWKKKDFEYEITENPVAHYYVYEEDDTIVGYVGFWTIYEQAQITTIGVRKEYQHKGIGQQLMDQVTLESIESDCEQISLEVRISNEKAIRLYEKNGFITVNTRKGYYQDNHEDAYLMVKPIGGLKDE